ncbi:MAG: EF-hand domain-containing protein [Sphingomicrobium sp.]
MVRFLAGAAACFLFLTGAFLLWQSHTQQNVQLPPPPNPRLAPPEDSPINLTRIPQAPSADPKNKEEKRFDRADKNKDGTVKLAELVEPRRKPFAKLDLNKDGKLSFE